MISQGIPLRVDLSPRTAVAVLAGFMLPLALVLSGCGVSITSPDQARSRSSASGSAGANASHPPDAVVAVVNDGHTGFDQNVKNAIADVQAFWRKNYPQISGGRPYPELRGGIYSVDGSDLPAAVKANACLRQDPSGAVNNAFYCNADDSVVYDRSSDHLIAQLAAKYGDLMIAAVIAHEWGHAIQQRLGTFSTAAGQSTIFTETQADCASGAFIATTQRGQDGHVSSTEQQLETMLLGYLQVRDPPPLSAEQISHGNGFDRLSAMADGVANGPAYCFGAKFRQRQFTERPYTSDTDYLQQGNVPYADVIAATPSTPDASTLQSTLNAYWSTAANSVNKTWQDVQARQTSSPNCPDAPPSEFEYCPAGNYVYFQDDFARQAYNSLPDKRLNQRTGQVSLVDNAPADYSLGMLFVYGWAMAVRSQLFHASTRDRAALLAASCYSGAFTASVNTDQQTGFQLSPPDMDEATAAVIRLVPAPQAYGAHDTTALERISTFTKGYFGGLPAC